ncbi:hypothetical protein HHK36_016784 [Tetracentron sinense]|uniref:Uncharacterized protein n=1 Tax=Tetracentron sinense TaxID=13715 RepID=A0A834YXS7_TETSI|nr:hypothetical protein HHK36_016784 [Tetracentron sinense]
MRISKELLLFIFNLSLVATFVHGSSEVERKVGPSGIPIHPYVIYMGDAPETGTAAVEDHHNLLSLAIGDENIARESRIHSYGRSFNGFVARLLPHEAKRLSEKESVVSVFANTQRKLHTTRSWDFVGMPETLKRNTQGESNIIVGLLDTGIWVEAPSFNDKGYGPPPPKWKGTCAKGANFSGCNNKVIGARYYKLDNTEPQPEEPSPVDTEGHGTHTSSTAAGISVKGASLYGLAKGTARGGVPSARIAMYKVCWGGGCSDIDILAAFDDAIADGIDVISISIGGPSRNYFDDPIAIGAFHAIKKGILTASSAGNDGPTESTIQNVAPWIMTVAATGIDREFRTAVRLGNGMKTSGISINTFSPRKQMYPLTSGAQAANLTGESYGNVSACDSGTLDKNKIKGKIVYCLGIGGQDYTIGESGGIGTIMAVDEEMDIAFPFLIPATYVYTRVGNKIDLYINSTNNNLNFVNIDGQPDIAAPGLDILAAYSKLASVTGYPSDNRFGVYNIISGTSMACPHAAAAAAYVKTFHPDWSPAAIKSALMTTATKMRIKGVDAELGYGSGQINPARALHPGLVYDIRSSLSAYISFLCKEGYNETTLGLVTGVRRVNCSSYPPAQGTDGLNYPSMHIQLARPNSSIAAVFRRTVTQVEDGKSVYKVTVASPKDLSITVIPSTLSFDRLNQQRSFKVVLKGAPIRNAARILSASIEWSDSKHSVRSPILVYKPLY